MIVAVTGSIGSGKSVVARQLAVECQAEFLDIDDFCRKQLGKGKLGWQLVKRKWGKTFLDQEGEIDRQALRQAIFESSKTRRELENILHPLAKSHVLTLKQHHLTAATMIIVEVPLLFEVGWQGEFDMVITVSADNDKCLQRVVRRDGGTLMEAQQILDTQMPVEEKIAGSDYVIDNSKNWKSTLLSISDLSKTLREMLSSMKA